MDLKFHEHKGNLLLILLLFCLKSFGQELSTNTVASPSPSLAGMARYSEVPVDQSTGIPQISIPIYSIESQKLSYPISLSYHASGIKVNDISGPVGLGWTIGAGGAITRIMRGRPDEKPNGFFQYASAIPNATDNIPADQKDNLATRAWDMMPDLFYYNTGTTGGKFVFDNQLQLRTIPRNVLKVSPNNTSTLSSFTITDPAGTTYEFDPGETATATIPGIGSQVSYISSWYLSNIISADKIDTIRFNYVTHSSSYSYTTAETSGLAYYINVPPNAAVTNAKINPLSSNISVTVTGTRYLSDITYKGGKLSFVFSGGRTDDTNGKKLDQVVIYTKNPVTGSFIEDKKINFSYSYFTNTDGSTRLRLDSFREQYNSTTFNPPYIFSYSTKMLPPVGSAAQDHWGYYNGAELNTNLIPAYAHGSTVLSSNDRNVDPLFVDGCMLKSIVSPLTGVTEFYFEQNKYFDGSANINGPGLRINKIINRDLFSAINTVTNYEYLNPLTGKSSGKLLNAPSYLTTLDVVDMSHEILKEYQCVLIQTNGTSVGNFSGAPLIYEYVTTYNNNDVNASGKTVSKYSIYNLPTNSFPYFPLDDLSWLAGDLLTQEVYKVQGGVSTLVKKIENTYVISPHYYIIKGLSAVRKKVFFYGFPGPNDFYIKNHFSYSEFPYLKETKIFDYEQNSNTISNVTTVNNYYDRTNVHLFPTRIKTSTSISTDTLKKELKYPLDYTATGVIATMKNLNIIAQPLEVKNILVKNGTSYVTGYNKTEFFEWKTGKVYPRNFYTGKLPLNLTKSTFDATPGTYTRHASKINAYDKVGHPIETQIIGGLAQALIVDKLINRAIASSGPASANQIAYSSFESSDFGNWKVTTGVVTSTKNVSLNLSKTYHSIYLSAGQTISYSYTTTKSNGPNPILAFSRSGVSPVNVLLSNASGSGSVTLAAGSWNVELIYDFNVTALSANFSYQQTSPALANIVTTRKKTGSSSLQLTSVQKVVRDSLPSGTYTVVYYQHSGSITLTPLNGAVVVNTTVSPAEGDGWTKVEKEITISGLTQGIQLSGPSMFLDELRLYPKGAVMVTTCYDAFKNVITKTDANMRSVFTEYDERRRIRVVRDHERNILQQYDYTLAVN